MSRRRGRTRGAETVTYVGVLDEGEHRVLRVSGCFGAPLDPAASLKVRNHSPTGFCWGYAGSGPAQLALALLLDALQGRPWAEKLYQQFKAEYVQNWKMDGTWEITRREIQQWAMTKGWGSERSAETPA